MVTTQNIQPSTEATTSNNFPTKYLLSPEQIAQYHKDGFVVIKGFFTADEIEPIRKACAEDPSVMGYLTPILDSFGKIYKVTTWTELGDSYLGVLPRIARIVDNAEALLGEECYHWHSKILKKDPFDEGTVDWHQDCAFWYQNGCLFPHFATCTVAITENTKENGCIQMVKGSHLTSRFDMARGTQAVFADPQRVKETLKRLEVVDCEMNPGDVMFFHGNTLHCSGPNLTGTQRTVIHCHYNAVSNAPFWVEGQEHHQYKPIQKLPDSVIKDGGYNSVFETHNFHPPEQGESGEGGLGIFKKQDWYAALEKNYDGEESPFANLETKSSKSLSVFDD